MTGCITAIGIATPEYHQSQKTAAEKVALALNLQGAEKRLLRSVYHATGIDKRHSVIEDICKEVGDYTFFPNNAHEDFPSTSKRMMLYKTSALPLALKAIENCLQSMQQSFDLANITHVITVSCTGMYAPGLDIELVQQLNLSPQVKRTCINFMGCYGAFNAIKMAHAICSGSDEAKVLVVSVELCTLHFQKNDSLDNIIANSIFSDGAAAVIIEATTNQPRYLNLISFHCDLLAQHAEAMTWHIGDNGFDIVLSSYVPAAIEHGIGKFTQRMLEKTQLNLSDIQFFAIHPGGKKILEACETALQLSKHDNRFSYDVLRQYGNMSSATVLFVLKSIWDDLMQTGLTNQSIFSCAFGPGLTLESMLLRST